MSESDFVFQWVVSWVDMISIYWIPSPRPLFLVWGVPHYPKPGHLWRWQTSSRMLTILRFNAHFFVFQLGSWAAAAAGTAEVRTIGWRQPNLIDGTRWATLEAWQWTLLLVLRSLSRATKVSEQTTAPCLALLPGEAKLEKPSVAGCPKGGGRMFWSQSHGLLVCAARNWAKCASKTQPLRSTGVWKQVQDGRKSSSWSSACRPEIWWQTPSIVPSNLQMLDEMYRTKILFLFRESFGWCGK